MKTILATVIVGLSFIGSSTASAQSLEQILGAVAGYQLGNSIGDGDGRRAARVIGATIGYRYGDALLDTHHKRNHNWEPPRIRNSRGYYATNDWDRFYNYCRNQVPHQYRHDYGLAESWINGCVARLRQEEAELQAQAYQDGLKGR